MTVLPFPNWLKAAGWRTLIVALSPAFALIRFQNWWTEKAAPRPGSWQRGFAWMPTRLGTWQGTFVWLEPIERGGWRDFTICRRPGDTSIRAPWEYGDDE